MNFLCLFTSLTSCGHASYYNSILKKYATYFLLRHATPAAGAVHIQNHTLYHCSVLLDCSLISPFGKCLHVLKQKDSRRINLLQKSYYSTKRHDNINVKVISSVQHHQTVQNKKFCSQCSDQSSSSENMVKVLNVAEKNDVAKNIANILARGGQVRVSTICKELYIAMP